MNRLRWLLCGEHPLRQRGVLVGQQVRRRGESKLYQVTRIARDGQAWGRATGKHESGPAAQEVAADEVARRRPFTSDHEAAVIALLVQRFGLSEETAADHVRAVRTSQ